MTFSEPTLINVANHLFYIVLFWVILGKILLHYCLDGDHKHTIKHKNQLYWSCATSLICCIKVEMFRCNLLSLDFIHRILTGYLNSTHVLCDCPSVSNASRVNMEKITGQIHLELIVYIHIYQYMTYMHKHTYDNTLNTRCERVCYWMCCTKVQLGSMGVSVNKLSPKTCAPPLCTSKPINVSHVTSNGE